MAPVRGELCVRLDGASSADSAEVGARRGRYSCLPETTHGPLWKRATIRGWGLNAATASETVLPSVRRVQTSPTASSWVITPTRMTVLAAWQQKDARSKPVHVAPIGITATTHVPHRLCRVLAGRSRSQPVRDSQKRLLWPVIPGRSRL